MEQSLEALVESLASVLKASMQRMAAVGLERQAGSGRCGKGRRLWKQIATGPLGDIFITTGIYIYTIIYIYCNICIKNKWRFISQTFFPDLEVSCDEQCNQSQALRELQQACSSCCTRG